MSSGDTYTNGDYQVSLTSLDVRGGDYVKVIALQTAEQRNVPSASVKAFFDSQEFWSKLNPHLVVLAIEYWTAKENAKVRKVINIRIVFILRLHVYF